MLARLLDEYVDVLSVGAWMISIYYFDAFGLVNKIDASVVWSIAFDMN